MLFSHCCIHSSYRCLGMLEMRDIFADKYSKTRAYLHNHQKLCLYHWDQNHNYHYFSLLSIYISLSCPFTLANWFLKSIKIIPVFFLESFGWRSIGEAIKYVIVIGNTGTSMAKGLANRGYKKSTKKLYCKQMKYSFICAFIHFFNCPYTNKILNSLDSIL